MPVDGFADRIGGRLAFLQMQRHEGGPGTARRLSNYESLRPYRRSVHRSGRALSVETILRVACISARAPSRLADCHTLRDGALRVPHFLVTTTTTQSSVFR